MSAEQFYNGKLSGGDTENGHRQYGVQE